MQNLWIIALFFLKKDKILSYQSCDFCLVVSVLDHLESCADT